MAPAGTEDAVTEVRRQPVARTIKVDQAKVDHLLELVGELTVAKNALPFLAREAEQSGNAFAAPELSKNRIEVASHAREAEK
ncbi:MAG: hypothetical protein LH609_13705 [Rudanella sp.]|nr:hypothetical protein [Rudanella sp.]